MVGNETEAVVPISLPDGGLKGDMAVRAGASTCGPVAAHPVNADLDELPFQEDIAAPGAGACIGQRERDVPEEEEEEEEGQGAGKEESHFGLINGLVACKLRTRPESFFFFYLFLLFSF